ncbi:MAG: hypothetical protein EOO20_05075 [Chryseobacterium sp.]|nr:MAG: hypothetical protein EOO20_05075 [Chryseobacterium sp.]
MNIYSLSRSFWDFSFENPDMIKPTHIGIYFFAIEHCNRLGWKDKFGFPTSMVIEAIGVKSYSVYKKHFDDLVEYGFFEVHEYSKNQWSSNIIALKENYKADNKALDKALTTHTSKQEESTCESTQESMCQSTDSIDIQIYKSTNLPIYKSTEDKPEQAPELILNYSFDDFWNDYDKKIGKKEKLIPKWQKLKNVDRQEIKDFIPKYKLAQPDKRFRKNPETFLNNQGWKDELIFEKDGKTGNTIEQKRTERNELVSFAGGILANIAAKHGY